MGVLESLTDLFVCCFCMLGSFLDSSVGRSCASAFIRASFIRLVGYPRLLKCEASIRAFCLKSTM